MFTLNDVACRVVRDVCHAYLDHVSYIYAVWSEMCGMLVLNSATCNVSD